MAFGRAGGATVKLSVDDQQFVRDLVRDEARFKRSTSNMNADIGKLSRGALAGSGVFKGFARSIAFASTAFLGGAGLAFAVRTAFTELSDATKVAAQTNAVLKSTGQIAGVTAKDVDMLASALMRKSGIDDEAIKSGENLLLTFTNVRNVAGAGNDIFRQATKATLDMSVAMGEDLNSSVIRVGKALQDPIKGVTALRRVGVALTNDQQALIKRLVETGHVMEAQKIILRELTTEFGGSAAAAGRTFPGQIARLRETLKNLSAELLKDLIPSIERITQRLLRWLDNTKNQQRVQDDFRKVIRAVGQALSAIHKIFDLLAPVVRAVTRAVGGAENAFKLLFALGIALKIRGIANSFGLGRGGLAGNVGLATGRVGGLKGALAGLPTRLVIQVAIATSIYGPAKKFFENQFGATYGGVEPDVPGAGGSPYPKGTNLNDAYQAGKAGKAFPASLGPGSSAERAAYQAGKKAARSPQASTSVSAPSSGDGAAPPSSGSSKGDGGGGGTSLASSQGYQGAVSIAPGADRGGVHTKPIVVEFVRRLSAKVGRPLRITTGTNHNEYVVGTRNVSDHWSGNAADIAASGAWLTHLGQNALMVAGASPAWAAKQGGGAFNVGGANILFNTKVGGNHFKHLHVGVHSLARETDDGGAQIVSGKPKPQPPSVAGFAVVSGGAIMGSGAGGFIAAGKAAISTAEGVRTGTVSGALNIPGLGKVLVGTEQKPTVEAIDKQIALLIKKGQAAVARRAAKQAAVAKLSRVKSRVGRAARLKMIARLKKEIAQLTKLINDIREELGALYSTRAGLVEEMASAAEAAAQEAEGGAGDGGAGDGNNNEKNINDGLAAGITDIPQSLRLGAAEASLTPDTGDDVFFARQTVDLYQARLATTTDPEQRIELISALQSARGALASASTAVPLNWQLEAAQARLTPSQLDDRAVTQKIVDMTEARLKEAQTIEEQIALTNQLVDVKSQLNQLQSDEASQLIQFLNARREIARSYGSTVLGTALSGAQITIQNFNQATPADPHLFSQNLQFELQAIVG